MFIPQLENLEKYVEDNNVEKVKNLLTKTNRTQNRTQNFKSALMLSAHNLKHLLKMDSLESDCIILNLEDGVSKDKKPMALVLSAYFLNLCIQSSKKIVVRVNSIEDGGLQEIKFLNEYKPDAIRVPKIRNISEIKQIVEVLDDSIDLHLSIETKEAYTNLKELQYEGRVKAVYLGILDLFADLGLSQDLLTPTNPMLHHILAEFLISSKFINAYAVSFVYQDYKNMNEFRKYLELEKIMGFTAKGCVSPTQSKEIMSVFEVEDKSLEKARYIVELFEKMKEQGSTGFADDKYGFIDEPIYKGALKLVGKQ